MFEFVGRWDMILYVFGRLALKLDKLITRSVSYVGLDCKYLSWVSRNGV